MSSYDGEDHDKLALSAGCPGEFAVVTLVSFLLYTVDCE